MATYKSNELLDKVIADTQAVIRTAKADFGTLSEEELRWKPAANKWSIAECMEHIIMANNVYRGNIDKAYAQLSVRQKEPKPDFKQSWMGAMFTHTMKPKEGNVINYKMTTFKVMDPAKSNNGHQNNVLDKYIEMNEYFIEKMEQARDLNMEQIKVTSALGPIVRFKLGDAFLFLTAHTQRHLLQAQNVKAMLPSVAMA